MSILPNVTPHSQAVLGNTLTLVSHHLCPYVQRAAIALAEKGVAFDRVYVDLADKPAWFKTLSPLGKVPVLHVGADASGVAIFESAVILEYLEETQARPLHPADPLQRAQHRGWIEFGSSILNQIGAFYSANTDGALFDEAANLAAMFARLEQELEPDHGPWFASARFSLVDAVYGPIFRYFDVFDQIDNFAILDGKPKTTQWRNHLASRESIKAAVPDDYPARLLTFLLNRQSALSARICPDNGRP